MGAAIKTGGALAGSHEGPHPALLFAGAVGGLVLFIFVFKLCMRVAEFTQ